MNLIEQLGGYENVSKHFNRIEYHAETKIFIGELFGFYSMRDLKDALLEHRRKHNIFEAGDKVIIVQKVWGEDPWDDLCYVFNAKTHHIVGVGIDISVGFGSSQAYRHATSEEIKAGRRL